MNKLILYILALSAFSPVCAEEITDTIDITSTGITVAKPAEFTCKDSNSHAEYQGIVGNSKNDISLRPSLKSGIVSTVSGGKLKAVTIDWSEATFYDTEKGQLTYIQVYASKTAYISSGDLYDEATAGTLITDSLYTGENMTMSFPITDDFGYCGVRVKNKNGAVKRIIITWESDSNSSVGEIHSDKTGKGKKLSISGQAVTPAYKGIVVEKNKKYLAR